MDILTMKDWSPYAVGIGIGLLNCIAVIFSDKFIGCSAAFSRTSGLIEKVFIGSTVLDKPYYKKFIPEIDWEWILVAGIAVVSFSSAQLSEEFQFCWIPTFWDSAFGDK